MGLVRAPELQDYWSSGETFHYAPIADHISRNRFEEITRYLHFVDKQNLPARGAPGYHRLQHVKPVLDALRERFSDVYISYIISTYRNNVCLCYCRSINNETILAPKTCKEGVQGLGSR